PCRSAPKPCGRPSATPGAREIRAARRPPVRIGCSARPHALGNERLRRGAGVVDRGGLENRCTPLGYRGFESLPLRQHSHERTSRMKLPGATTKIAPNTACFWAELEAH